MRNNVVVMGGGTGIFPVVQALHTIKADISAIIAVSDSGGSTGRIRDEFGFQPVGDLRQSLAALASNDEENWIEKILLYRFSKGTGLKGHNLGNLILTALQDMTGDTTTALEIAEKVFRIHGTVIPATKENVQLQIHYADGSSAIGEHILDEREIEPKKINSVSLTPAAPLNPQAIEALKEADLILIGPGDYFASIMAVLVAEGVKDVFAEVTAPVVYNLNLMTRATQTKDMTASDHVRGIEQAIGRKLDKVVVNSQAIDPTTLQIYANEQEFPVMDDLGDDDRVLRRPLLADQLVQTAAYDTAHRSLLRHDREKLKQVFQELLA